MSWLGILLVFSLVEHVLFARMLGLDPGTAEGPDPRRAAAAGLATALLAAASAAAVWALRVRVLEPLDVVWLQTPAIVLATAGIAALARLVLRQAAPLRRPWLRRGSDVPVQAAPRVADLFGPVLRPSGASVAALGTVLVAARSGFGLTEGIAAGLAAGAGLLVALSILGGIADRLGPGEEPSAMSGLPRTLVSAGLAALAFTAFDRVFLAGLVR
jgi:Na+-translocating ferredoxin:NAD+ oxidoreductase RnfA subunit